MLRAVRRGGFVDRAFERLVGSLDEADRRLAHELAFGVLRLRGRLDFVIEPFVDGGLQQLEEDVLDILRLSAYQLLELDRVPVYAVVSDAVELTKGISGRGAAGLVNAVLRRLSHADRSEIRYPSLKEQPLRNLETWGSHPTWLLQRWLTRWPVQDVRRLVEYNNRRPAVYLSLLGHRRTAVERLAAVGIAAESVRAVPNSIRVRPADLQRALSLVSGVVQDAAAAAVVLYSACAPGGRVADLCAAPGGKAAMLAGQGCQVVALDISRHRLQRLLETRSRLGLDPLRVVRGDARWPPLRPHPAVLLDVPCTGTGTLARHPDGRWRLQPADLVRLVEIQRALLDAAATVVTPGGRLIYATCSLEPEENEEQVSAFLKRHEEFELDSPRDVTVNRDLLTSAGELQVLPQDHGMDGAYAARLRRRGD